MAVQHDLDLIRGLEEELFKQAVRASPAAVGALLADDFVEFGRSGRVYDKREIVLSLAAEGSDPPLELAASGFELKSLADDVVLLTYRTRRLDGDRALHTLRSSIWKFSDGAWRMMFHQGTPTDET
ncbi:MAG TPA: DUF4440 domain-containing protein [Mesorhizobium sp.]|uniref:nuclear transport factor 2 family protein n=1 Tax=Mesorhizobium sp. TaxID=1871066 RepID=UPI002DDDABBF|nr:DUF4440 domain-containing protein [Mesorhizobium sp.]HEV2505203.1 DUF4440 domain-containing protein [Mesorhizobium sp.]